MIEKWREKLLEEAKSVREIAVKRIRERVEERVDRVNKVYDVKIKIIERLRTEPDNVFGNDAIFVRTDNHLLVHDVARALDMKLDRSAENNGFNFKGVLGDVEVCVYGIQEVPHCRIISKKAMKEITTYEVVCNGVAE